MEFIIDNIEITEMSIASLLISVKLKRRIK